MRNIAKSNEDYRRQLFLFTSELTNQAPAIVEKDFWVCFMLDHLFHHCAYQNAFVFKGGTSLSKSYHVIERFSEDIDLILDWRKLETDQGEPWDDRSKTKQDQYNKRMNHLAAVFYRDQLVPTLNAELSNILGDQTWITIEENDEMVLNFHYPLVFTWNYMRQEVRLEIGPLAEWCPSHETEISSYAAETHPEHFQQGTTQILTIDVERTFWEKTTILHKIAHFQEGKPLPARYARHLYDVYCMGNSWVKEKAFDRKELLERDIAFKTKFYYTKSAHYDSATLKDIVLVPDGRIREALKADYKAMRNMIYGEVPDFDEIIRYLEELQEEIHRLA